jgi:hypothetical protein
MSAPYAQKPLTACTNLELVQTMCSGKAGGWLFWGSRGSAISPAGEVWHRDDLLEAVNDLRLNQADAWAFDPHREDSDEH